MTQVCKFFAFFEHLVYDLFANQTFSPTPPGYGETEHSTLQRFPCVATVQWPVPCAAGEVPQTPRQ